MPAGVSVVVEPGRVQVTGPLGELTQVVPLRMSIDREGDTITVTRPTERGEDRSLHGLMRKLAANMAEGVGKGFVRQLEINGVGYRAEVKGTAIHMTLGYSHPIVYQLPPGVTAKVERLKFELESVEAEVGY